MKRGSLRSPIPPEQRNKLAEDPWMKVCIIHGAGCSGGRIEWQHGFTYAGKRINELWAILPMCHDSHVHEAKFRPQQEREILYRITYFDATEEFRRKFPKSHLIHRFES